MQISNRVTTESWTKIARVSMVFVDSFIALCRAVVPCTVYDHKSILFIIYKAGVLEPGGDIFPQ